MLNDGRSFKRHIDQLRLRTVADSTVNPMENDMDDCLPPPTITNESGDAVPNTDPPL